MGFFSTFEKQLDGKRRIVVPQEFRAQATGPFEGLFCFPSIEADCIECGGQALFDRYKALIEGLPFGDPDRAPLEQVFFGGLKTLGFDPAGRITLPDMLCEQFGIETDVVLVGLGERFQIWPAERFRAQRETTRLAAREVLSSLRTRPRGANAA